MANSWINKGFKPGSAEENAWILSVFEQQGKRAWVLALAIVGQLTDAEDVLQESLLKLMRKARKGSINHPAAYLRAIVRTTALDLLAKRRSQQTIQAAVYACPEDEQLNSPLDSIQNKESVRQLNDALSQLPRRLAKVIIARDICQQSYAQIAENLDITQSTARIYHWRGLRQLRDILCRD